LREVTVTLCTKASRIVVHHRQHGLDEDAHLRVALHDVFDALERELLGQAQMRRLLATAPPPGRTPAA
jgi:hypothetical protein